MAMTHTFEFDVGEIAVLHSRRFPDPVTVEIVECRKTPGGNVYGVCWSNNHPGQSNWTKAGENVLRRPRPEDNAP